ncbi:hypothetical protein MIR68_000526 [Amoeboaphelidium protococcarum]|nr:hypothetical protein MIR68_000526 [Amoeboaphelidium protococcarum]
MKVLLNFLIGGCAASFFKDGFDMFGKERDEVDFSRFCSSGVLEVNYWHRERQRDSLAFEEFGGEQREFSAAVEDDIQVETLSRMGFSKVKNGNRFKMDLYPLNDLEDVPDSDLFAQGRRHLRIAPMVVIGHDKDVFVLEEGVLQRGKGDQRRQLVKCTRYRQEPQKKIELGRSHLNGLTFENNRLCLKYSDVLPHRSKNDKCQIRESDLYLDPFTKHVMEMSALGRVYSCDFAMSAVFHEWSWDVSNKHDQMKLRLPHDVSELCREGDLADESDRHHAVLVHMAQMV